MKFIAKTSMCIFAAGSCALAYSNPAHADQESSPSPAAQDEMQEVLVTAQYREQRSQDIPIAITAVGAESLEQRGVLDVADLKGIVPGLTVSGFAGVTISNLISLRGVAGQSIPIGASLPTAVYLDGVYLSRPDAAFFSLDDVERIEVLRGPQGTLYGRNATAGAINIVTRIPKDVFEGGLNVSAGNYDSRAVRGSITGPIGGGFSFGLSGAFDTFDGFYTNTATGNRVGSRNSYTGRGKLRYDSPEGHFDAIFSADSSKLNAHEYFRSLLGPASAGSPYIGVGDEDHVTTNDEYRTEQPYESRGVGLVMNFDIRDNLTLTTVSSARKFESFIAYDFDGTTLPTFFATSGNESETWSQEARVLYTGQKFRLTTGVNYYHEEASFFLGVNPPPGTILRNPLDTTEVDAIAGFGQIEYDLTSALTLVGGLRYNHEKRDFTIAYSAPVVPLKTGSLSDGDFLPSVGLNFKVHEDLLVYAKISEGYQPPGFSYLPGPNSAPPFTFERESLRAYEAGIKSQWLDRRLTLNTAAFFYDYKDMQIRTVRNATDTKVENAAAATVKGVEVELSYRPVDRLTISAQTTYSKAVYDEFCEPIAAGSPLAGNSLCPGGEADRSGNALNFAPRWSGGVNVAQSVPVTSSLDVNWNASYSFESESFFTSPNELAASNPDGYERLDARIGLGFKSGLEVYAYGRNLTDDRYVTSAVRSSPTVVFGAISDPRTYGLGARYTF